MKEVMNASMLTASCIINEPCCVEDNSSKELVMNTTLHFSTATEKLRVLSSP